MMIPMSSTGGGGAGGGGVAVLPRFFAAAPGFGLGFELPAAGVFALTAGLAAVGACAPDTDASAHAATRAAARFKARGSEASMAADSTRRRARPRSQP